MTASVQPEISGQHHDVSTWTREISRALDPVTVTPIGAMLAMHRTIPVGGVRISSIRATPGTVTRDDAEGPPGLATVRLALQLDGVCTIRQGGRTAELKPGEFSLYRSDAAYSLRFEKDFAIRVVRIPRSALSASDEALEELICAPLPTSGVSELLPGMLRGVIRMAHPTSRNRAEPLLTGLITAIVADARGSAPQVRQADIIPALEPLTSNPGLTPRIAAQRVHLSVRQLHRRFAAEGTTFGTWLRHERLRHARTLLVDSADPVSVVATACGFRSSSHFARVFTADTGMSPRQWRAARRAGTKSIDLPRSATN